MKHAFLIMAHNNYSQLTKLIESLDYNEVGIFLHIDSKSPEYKEIPKLKYAKLYSVPRMCTTWGGYSLVEGELRLLEYAHKTNKFDYYHLISGQDMILCPMREFDLFFEKNKGKEFIHFDRPEKSQMRYERIKYYMIFQDFIGKKRKTFFSISQSKIILPLQKLLGVDRTKKSKWIFKSGSQWFSITDELVCYVLDSREEIKKNFKYTMCDEMFLQTLVYNSLFKNRLYNKNYDDSCLGNQRYIDWKRGTPYVFRYKDFDELIHSNCLFARKFDEKVDSRIIDKIYAKIQLKNN